MSNLWSAKIKNETEKSRIQSTTINQMILSFIVWLFITVPMAVYTHYVHSGAQPFDRGNADSWYNYNASIFTFTGLSAFFAMLTAKSNDKKSLAIVLGLVNLITLCSYLTIAKRLTPNVPDSNGYPVDFARYLEWIACCPNMVLLIGEFTKDAEYTSQTFLNNYVMLCCGFLASVTGESLSIIFTSITVYLFIKVMTGLHRMYSNAIDGRTGCTLDRTMVRIANITTTFGWSLFPIVWFLVRFKVISFETGEMLYCFGDIVAKAFLTLVLVNATIEHVQNETIQRISGIASVMEREMNNTDVVLEKFIPPEVLSNIKEGNFPEAQDYESVTILLSDITNYNVLSARNSTRDVLKTLDSLWSKYEEIGKKWGIYKVETIGDAYLGVSGCPTRSENHAENCLNFALDILEMATEFKTETKEGIQIRIGIHSGPVVAGLMGANNPRWCIVGDSVSTASRIEALSKPMRINISESTYELVKDKNMFEFSGPNSYEVKGKGRFNMYWVSRLNKE